MSRLELNTGCLEFAEAGRGTDVAHARWKRCPRWGGKYPAQNV